MYDMNDPSAIPMLEEALQLVNGARQKSYGSPLDNWTATARILSSIVGKELSAEQAALLMIGVKLARLATSPNHRDSLVDIAGYIAVIDLIIQERKARTAQGSI